MPGLVKLRRISSSNIFSAAFCLGSSTPAANDILFNFTQFSNSHRYFSSGATVTMLGQPTQSLLQPSTTRSNGASLASISGRVGPSLRALPSQWTSDPQYRALRTIATPCMAPVTPTPISVSYHSSSDTETSDTPKSWVLPSSNSGSAGNGNLELKKKSNAELAYLTGRARVVTQHFPTAIGIDDFLHRLEIALYAYGFNGDNSIAMVNLCRDEITVTLKHKIDQVFGSSFNTNGLGGVLTSGVTGISAGLSHAPVSKGSGKERYVFFSFPHISIDARGEMGTISRPGRPGTSCACGALNQALIDIKTQGLSANCKIPGVHAPLDPEFTILKQRLARRLRYDGVGDAEAGQLDLVAITKVAERTIADDLDYLISHTVDPRKADYAVVTGVQIHNWGTRFDDESPNLEFVAPSSVYVVVNGEKTHIDLNTMPSLTPRQIRILSSKNEGGDGSRSRDSEDVVCNSGGSSTLREIDPPYLYNSREKRRHEKQRAETFASLIAEDQLSPDTTCPWPSWQSNLRTEEGPAGSGASGNSAMHFDDNFSSVDEMDALWTRLQTQYVSKGPRKKADTFSDEDDGSIVPPAE